MCTARLSSGSLPAPSGTLVRDSSRWRVLLQPTDLTPGPGEINVDRHRLHNAQKRLPLHGGDMCTVNQEGSSEMLEFLGQRLKGPRTQSSTYFPHCNHYLNARKLPTLAHF